MPIDQLDAASTDSLSVDYGSGIVALRNLKIRIGAGSLSALIGPNGSGKTTLLRVLAGLERPSAGKTSVLGLDPLVAGRKIRAEVSYLFQETALDPEMTGLETLTLFAVLCGIPPSARAGRIREQIRRFGLETHSGRLVSTYSGGLRRRLHLALSLLRDYALMLLDEPESGLDPQGRILLWEVLRERASRGRCSLIATHDLAAAESYCDRVLLLHRGRLLAQGPPQEIRERFAVARMVIELAQPLSEGLQVETLLAGVPGVREVRSAGRRIELQVPSGEDLRAAILEVFDRHGLEVAALGARPPDLPGAFFALTGCEPTRVEDGRHESQ